MQLRSSVWKCHQKVVNNDDKTDGCCRFAEMFQKFVVTAALDYRLTDPISVCLENNPCVVLDLAEHAEIKTYVFLITVNFEDLIDLLQTLYCCKRACVVSQASCLCKYFAGPEQVWKFKECFFQRFRKFLFLLPDLLRRSSSSGRSGSGDALLLLPLIPHL